MVGTAQPPPPAAWSPPPGWYADPSRIARGRPLAIAGIVILGIGAALVVACWKLSEIAYCPNGCSASQQPTVSEVLVVAGFLAGLLLSLAGLIATVVGMVSARAGQVRHEYRYWDGHAWTPERRHSGFGNVALGFWLLAAGALVGTFGAASFSIELHGSVVVLGALLALLAAILLVVSGAVISIVGVAGRHPSVTPQRAQRTAPK